MDIHTLCTMPIERQLRIKGLRRVRDGELGPPVLCVVNAHEGTAFKPIPEPIAVNARELEQPVDPLVVILLRGFASIQWARDPDKSIEEVVTDMCSYSESIGATPQELYKATERIELVRE